MRTFVKVAMLATIASLASVSAEAHRTWLLPSSTVLSGDQPWVTVDAAVSNELFYFDHRPLQIEHLAVLAPDGKPAEAKNIGKGEFRSTFDVKLEQPGTYKIAVVNQGLFANYKLNGVQKRWRGKSEDLAKGIPAEATDVNLTESQGRIEVFVTSGKPTVDTLKPTGVGLELVPVTHPNNLVAGEKATFKLVLDGQPAKALGISIIPGGIRYRDQLNEIKTTTDDTGAFSVIWPGPGMYWVNASVADDKSSAKGAKRRATYTTTLEVMPQ